MKNPFKSLFTKSVNSVYSLLRQNDIFTAQQTLSPRVALEYNQTSLYINKGFSKRAEKVGEVEFVLKNRKTGDVIVSHEILDLLDNPSDQFTGDQFWRMACQYRDVTGMAVMRKVSNDAVFRNEKKIVKLELLNSAHIEVVESTSENKILYFRYSNPNTKQIEEIPYDDVIYWYIADPIRPLQPLPLLLAGLLSIQSNREMEKQYNATLKNGGSVDGLFRFKQGINAEQVDVLKRDYAQLLRDNKEAKVPLILGGDATFERIALSPNELQSVEAKKLLIDDLVAVTGVPKAILGLTSGDTFANADIAYRIFLREVIKPLIKDLVNVLDWKLVPEQYDLDFIDPTPEDVDTNLRKLESGARVGALTLNEKREMIGLEPVKNGDEIEKDEVREYTEKKKTTFQHPLKNEGFRDSYYKLFIKSTTQNKKVFKRELLKYFDGQKQRILANIRNLKGYTKDFTDDIFNETLEISYMSNLLKVMQDIARKEGQATMDLFSGGLDFSFNSGVDMAVKERFNFLANSINNTTSKVLNNEISDWFENKETVNDLIQRVSDVYDFKKEEKWRAETIVNTEVNTVTNVAKGKAYEQMGIPVKIWVHRAGIKGGVREDHEMMDGEEVAFNKPFSNGLMYPNDDNADPSETINCNCTW
jgi:HK97 family phage portal protein